MKKNNDKIMINIITLVSILIAILEVFLFIDNIDIVETKWIWPISILLFILTIKFIKKSKEIKDETKREIRVYIGLIILSTLIFPTIIGGVEIILLFFTWPAIIQ